MIFDTSLDNTIMNISIGLFLILFLFLFFLFMTFIVSLFKKRIVFSIPKEWPKVSLIIPAYNEEKNITRCLRSIENSDYDKRLLEVFVVDDGSKDNTAKLVTGFLGDLNIKLIKGKHKGKSEALNQAVRLCSNELVLSMDADINLRKNSIKLLVAPMLSKKVAATNCVAVIRKPMKFVEYFQMIEFSLNNLIRTSFSRVFDNSVWFFGAVACYKKSILEEIGFFKTDTLTEDMDICLEMFNKGYKIITVKEAVISTSACSSLKGLFIQRMRWYFGALQSLVKNRRLLKRGTPSILFLFFNQFWWTFFSLLFFPLTAYQIYYWWPQTEAVMYLVRWFSLLGPFTVLYKVIIEEWYLSFYNMFGVMSGFITLFMTAGALSQFKGKVNLKTIICIFFYFPYTIVQNMIIISGLVKYAFKKKRYFI